MSIYHERPQFPADIGWDYPENTVLVKNFLMPENERSPGDAARRIETRLFYVLLGDSPNGCGVNTPCFPSIKDAIENARI